MKNRKSILLIIILMVVGFAAVSTTLFINGSTNINPNQEDFNVYYSDAYVNGVQDKSVITDDTHISFTTELSKLGEKYVLDYEVTNGSKNYDAELEMVCIGGNDYLSVTNEFDDENILVAKDSRDGKLTLELTKSNAGEDVDVTITCTISANAVERTSLGIKDRSEISVAAKDENNTDLNAKAYEITGNEKVKLLDGLVETGYVTNASEVDALIEVESDEFDSLATTTFDVSSIASEGDKVVILHFNEETQEWEYVSEEIVDENGKVIADFTSYSPVAFVVVKEDGTIEVKYKTYEIGDEITINKEKFNVINQTEDTVTMLAQYNLSSNYRQSTTNNYLYFSNGKGWVNTPGPKEIDIYTWSSNPKMYINAYVDYLSDYTNDSTITGNLITISELKPLGCTINDKYVYTTGLTCATSEHASWLVNSQNWWTRSAGTDNTTSVWYVASTGILYGTNSYNNVYGIRPVITISKEALVQNDKKNKVYEIGYESKIAGEGFNLIGVSDDKVTLLAQYNLGTDYKQTTTNNYVSFSENAGWEYTPGPKEIDIQQYSGNVKNYINNYKSRMSTELNSDVSVNLMSLKQFKALGCTIKDDYSVVVGLTCLESKHSSWIMNNQYTWTQSAAESSGSYVWTLNDKGGFSNFPFVYTYGIRPTITISREVYKNLVS